MTYKIVTVTKFYKNSMEEIYEIRKGNKKVKSFYPAIDPYAKQRLYQEVAELKSAGHEFEEE